VEHASESAIVLRACHDLEEALAASEAAIDRRLVPTLPAVARRCVEQGIQAAVLLAPLSEVRDRLQLLSRSPFVKRDTSLVRLVDDARDEVQKISASPPPPLDEPAVVRSPNGTGALGAAIVSGSAVMNASPVVAGMAAGFRRCYNKGLREDPNMKGSLRITAKIGPNGEVTSVTPSASGLSGTVVACVAARVASAVFAPLERGEATIVIPVTFVNQ
jgi:hypothetical protein